MIHSFLDRIFWIHFDERFAQDGLPIPTKPRSRSVPDVAVLSAQPFSGCLLSADVFQGASFGIGSPFCASLSNKQVYMLVF
jgi:hypothetical protein